MDLRLMVEAEQRGTTSKRNSLHSHNIDIDIGSQLKNSDATAFPPQIFLQYLALA